MNVLEQSVVDQGLIVPAPSLVHLLSEVFQYGVGHVLHEPYRKLERWTGYTRWTRPLAGVLDSYVRL